MKRIIQQVLVLLTFCWMMPSCSDETFNYESGEGTGYLCLTLGKVDVEFSSSTRAETVSLPDELIPATADFMVDIQKDGNSIEGFPKKYSDITGEMELAVGSYTVKAEFGENNLIQESPYFSGTSTVQILPGKPITLDLQVALANAMLAPAVSESLQKHYNAWTLKTKVGETSMTLADNDNIDGYLFVQAGQSVDALFEGTNLLDKQTSHEWTVISSAEARTKYVIQCDPDIPVFSFGLNAVAEHTTDNAGYLNGTKVSLSFGDLSNVPLSLISEWKATLVNATGEVVRSYTPNDFNSTGKMSIENGWTYLPQGNYTLKYSYTIDNENITEEMTEAKTVTMPLPTFSVEVSAQTSYSVYISQGAAAANEKDGSGIFDVNSTVTISPDILSNGKYANLLSIAYTLDYDQTSTETSPIFQNLEWGTHTLTASVNFDGGSTVATKDCEVTGIPYKGDYSSVSPFDDTINSWICVGNGEYWSGRGYILFQYYFKTSKNCYVFSPAFQLPTTVSISYSTKVAYFTGGLGNPTIDVYTGVSESIENSVIDKTTSIKRINTNNNPGDEKFTVISDNTTIGNNYRICISHDGQRDGNAAENWLTFKSLEVLYR